MRTSQETLCAAVALARLGPWKYDVNKERFEFNDELYAIYGTSVAQEGAYMSMNQYTQEFVHPKDAWVIGFAYQQSTSSPERVYNYRQEHRIIRRDGVTRTIAALVRVTKDADGNVIGICGTSQDITEEKAAQAEVLSYQEKLQALASELLLTEERERRRLAVNLHDHISQPLALAKIKLNTLASVAEQQGCSCLQQNHEILEMLNQAIENSRSLTFDLCPPVLYELGFEASVQYLVESMEKQHPITVHLIDDGRAKPLDEEKKIILFRAIRELLINVIKHAQANFVHISISSDNEKIYIEVIDDGKGFQVSTVMKGFGLFNISERIHYIGGTYTIESTIGQGTKVILSCLLNYRHVGGV